MQMMQERQPITICGLVPYPLGTSPSQRFRIEQWRPELENKGISIDFLPLMDKQLLDKLYRSGHFFSKAAGMTAATVRRISTLARVRHYDAIFVHRGVCLAGPALLERLMALTGLPIIFDFDDAVHLLDTSEANRHFGWLKFPGKTASICRSSAHVVVGNSYLAEYAFQHNRRVTIIPSSVDTRQYRPVEKRASKGRVVVGWMGSSTSQTHLEAFAPVLREMGSRLEFELRIVSDREPVLPGIPFVWRRWSAETEIQDLGEFDIGIMPMPDDRWARGKCAMKALLYMSMGIPAICSEVGTNREVIEHGRNGFLAATPRDWFAQLGSLIQDPEQRLRLGAAGRETIEERYSMEFCAGSFARVIEETVASRGPAMRYEVPESKVFGKDGSISINE
jgi:glycosyltransferase involved in cell wall biosynthesis